VGELTRRFGRNVAGLIAVDSSGGVGYAFNTETLLWGRLTARDGRIRVQLSRA
jgi:isoaspartyl peptidase/L-asparaginase-like protein (Ntn-hydrolase superfamily)